MRLIILLALSSVLIALYLTTGVDGQAAATASVTIPVCPVRPKRGWFDWAWQGVKQAVGLAGNAASAVVNTIGNVAGWVFGGPWGAITPSAMNKAAIRAACGKGLDLSKENLAGKAAGLVGTVIGSVWSMVVPSSMNQGAINSAETMGQVSECVPVNGTTYPVDFVDWIKMYYSTVEERDRLLQAVVSAWNSIIKPYDPIGITIYYINATVNGDASSCTLNVIYRITGLTKIPFDFIKARPDFLNLFVSNPPMNMWPIPEVYVPPPTEAAVVTVTTTPVPAVPSGETAICVAGKTRGLGSFLSNVVSTIGNAVGVVFGGPWGAVTPAAMNKGAIRAACGEGIDLSEENLAGKFAGLAGTVIGTVWAAVVPFSVNQGAIAAAETIGQRYDCSKLNKGNKRAMSFPVDFSENIRMLANTYEERNRKLAAVLSAWITIFDSYGYTVMQILETKTSINDMNPCTVDVTYRIVGFTDRPFSYDANSRQQFAQLFIQNPPPGMWNLNQIGSSMPVPDQSGSASASAGLGAETNDLNLGFFGSDPSDIATLQWRLGMSDATIAELRSKGFNRVSDLALLRESDLRDAISMLRDRILLRELLKEFIKDPTKTWSAAQDTSSNSKFRWNATGSR